MKVFGELKDGNRFTYEDVVWINDEDGAITIYYADSTPEEIQKESLARITIDFLLPRPKIEEKPERAIYLE